MVVRASRGDSSTWRCSKVRGVVRDWRHGVDLVLVAVVTDLEERDEAGEPVLLGRLAWLGLGLGLRIRVRVRARARARELVLLGRLALDVKPLAHADAAEHLGDRVSRARPVDHEPG
eukprot:scaffold107820_cov45-Phaeocystis_antarctica.AAC.1